MEDLRKMEYKEHRARIREMKPTVDNQEPHKMPFSQKAATERRLYAEKVCVCVHKQINSLYYASSGNLLYHIHYSSS
jgi:hypothetical protein